MLKSAKILKDGNAVEEVAEEAGEESAAETEDEIISGNQAEDREPAQEVEDVKGRPLKAQEENADDVNSSKIRI